MKHGANGWLLQCNRREAKNGYSNNKSNNKVYVYNIHVYAIIIIMNGVCSEFF